ncbi:MAG: hypothetical protein KF774_00455 [Planctomyces sp.]|nr:hypothetical protein [Planctomyces sp.]
MNSLCVRSLACLLSLCAASAASAESAAVPDYETSIAPLLTRYCAGCHNTDDAEGKLSVSSFDELAAGGERGPAILPGDAGSSRLIRVLTGEAEPKMPPEGEAAPTADELALLRVWIDGGAPGPSGSAPDRMRLNVPDVPSRVARLPVDSVAASPDGKWIAVGEFQTVHLLSKTDSPSAAIEGPNFGEWRTVRSLKGLPGKVQALHFSQDSTQLVAASGVSGLAGQATIWNVEDGALAREFVGHRDALYDAELSPDGRILATCGYDRHVMLWDVETGVLLRTLEGHNGAVYDVAFSPDGSVLATASADDTCKIWLTATGQRLDTLPQPLKEAYCVAFTPDGQSILGSGADNRIRVWRFLSKASETINPQIHARFAHEGAIVQMALTPDGQRLATLADDRTLKLWETTAFTEIRLFEEQPAAAAALAIIDGGRSLLVGRMDGTFGLYEIGDAAPRGAAEGADVAVAETPDGEMTTISETEPNDDVNRANPLTLPATATGTIHSGDVDRPDVDSYRFEARAGQEWVLEINASRSGSPLDSYLEVLTADGRPVPRALLQAVQDSWFTFRGKDAFQSDDFRLFNWEEMELNQYLYCNGEVVKLWRYPRGPDSGFMLYPGEGSRHGYFDTTPLAHALGEPCYIVEPHPPGTELIPNGLPVFEVNYENDDDARRELGADSRLTFLAPEDGEYVVRVSDVRGHQGENYSYSLQIRPRRPDFAVTLHGANPVVAAGSAREFRVVVHRKDDYDGPVRVDIDGLPPGISATTPVIIQPGQLDAFGVLMADENAPEPTPENASASKVTATAEINGREVVHEVNSLGEIKLGSRPKLQIAIEAREGGARPVGETPEGLLEFVIEPGQTIMLNARAVRHDYGGQVPFGNAESGRNLPHGLYVDNIGLNGLLILEPQSEREFFITAAKWVPEQSRLFHLKTDVEGGHATRPVLLHVRRAANADAAE